MRIVGGQLSVNCRSIVGQLSVNCRSIAVKGQVSCFRRERGNCRVCFFHETKTDFSVSGKADISQAANKVSADRRHERNAIR